MREHRLHADGFAEEFVLKQLAIDVGGTFTDCLYLNELGHLQKFKAPTTPDSPSRGILDAVAKHARHLGLSRQTFLQQIDRIVHGTTIGINVLLTARGAQVGLITTAGFRDVIEMRRGIKNLHGSMFDQFIEPYRPLVPRSRRIGVSERTLYTGKILEPLNEQQVREAANRLVADGCDAIAIGFLHSYTNPSHEQRAKEIVLEVAPEAYVTASHEVLPVWREFERFSTSVVSAYIGPAIARHLARLEKELAAAGFDGALLIMLANGLVQESRHCIDRAVYLLGSGPAAAPFGAQLLGEKHGRPNLLSVDMGGTSFDVCLVRDGAVPTTSEGWVGEERVAIKMVDIASVGAGGGSIAWIDALGLLQVGPMSAGADPGPAAYGKSAEATVTDADIVLGYIPTDFFLGGEVTVEPELARQAVTRIGESLGLDTEEAAQAIFATATSVMADKITEICTKRGHDVRDFIMVAGGGAGGIHAAAIAERLGIPEVIVPRVSALLSAFGMLSMDLGQEYARSRFQDLSQVDPNAVQAIYDEMVGEAKGDFGRLGAAPEQLQYHATADARYVGQFHELEIPVVIDDLSADGISRVIDDFHQQYERLFGYAMRWQPVEFLTFRLKVTIPRPALELAGDTTTAAASPKPTSTRRCLLDGAGIDVPVYHSASLRAGMKLEGPALIDDPTTTVLVPTRFTCDVDDERNLVLLQLQVSQDNSAQAGTHHER
jgi:N-methylhydantoinase A